MKINLNALKHLGLILILFFGTIAMFAADFINNGISYNITSTSPPYTVEVTSNSPIYTGNITIPSSVVYNSTTYSVTSIGERAFYNCTGLTSISISNSVTSIGEWAFYFCTSLTSITIPNSVTSIGNSAFWNCKSLTSINVAIDNLNYASIDGVLYDKDIKTLIQCPTTKTSITIPNSVTKIGYGGFAFCSSLSSITIPNSVTKIGYGAFTDCEGLTSITIPNSVTKFEDYAFEDCISLTSITIPNSVTEIGGAAFSRCSGLISITIPSSVTKIGYNVFQYCISLTSINVTIDNLNYASIDGVLYDKDIKTLIQCPGAKTSITIPNSIIEIADYAFEVCSCLTSITIPNSITYIGHGVFWGCIGLTSITCNVSTPPALGTDVFGYTPKNIPLYVPAGSMDAYKVAAQWQDFIVTAIPPCTAASNMLVNNKTTTSAKLNWDANTGATAYMLRWRVKKGPGQWSYANLTGSETSYTMYGLTQETEYEYQMRTFCGSSYSAFTDLATFWSAYGCGTPTGLTFYAVDKTSGVVKWNGVGGATEFLLRYKKQSDVNWSYIWKLGSEDRQQLGCGSCNIADQLTPNTTYEWQLRSFCAVDRSRFSTFTDIQTFNTIALDKSNNEEKTSKEFSILHSPFSINIYPNPTASNLYINIKGNDKSNINFELINLQGQRISKGNFLGNTILQTKELDAGVYFIKFINEKQNIDILKFIKQ